MGSFSSRERAARAHDVALLRLHGLQTQLPTNYPVAQYRDELADGIAQAPVAEFLVALQRHGAFGDRRTSR